MADCIFCKIIKGDIPCSKIYEDEHVLSFLDINPINPGHCLVVPKNHYVTLLDIPPGELQACITACQKIAKAVYRSVDAPGFNLLQNNFREAGQLVDHLHFHLIPRLKGDGFLTPWRAKSYSAGEMEKVLEKIKAEI